MALRNIGRRWPAAPQMRLRFGRLQSRAYAEEYTGNAMKDKEKIAETQYIRKLEQEQKLAAKHVPVAETPTPQRPPAAVAETPPSTAAAASPTSESSSRNIAVVAGLIAAASGYWLLSRSPKKELKEATQEV